jgi:hypothetical protein
MYYHAALACDLSPTYRVYLVPNQSAAHFRRSGRILPHHSASSSLCILGSTAASAVRTISSGAHLLRLLKLPLVHGLLVNACETKLFPKTPAYLQEYFKEVDIEIETNLGVSKSRHSTCLSG